MWVSWNSKTMWLKHSAAKIFLIFAFEWHPNKSTWHSVPQLPKMKTNTIQNSGTKIKGRVGRERSNYYLGSNVQLKEINVVFPQDIQIAFMKEKPLEKKKNNMKEILNLSHALKTKVDRNWKDIPLTCITLFFRYPK